MDLTRRSFNAALLSLFAAPAFLRAAETAAQPTTRITYPGHMPAPDSPLSLWYRTPAAEWTDALPLGNGHLGAMVFGGVTDERLQLNHDTLWSGHPRDWDNPKCLENLPEMRKLVFDGKYAEANEFAKKMMGPYTQSYQPMADLGLTFDHAGEISDYRRDLDLSSATHTTRYSAGGITYTREAFISHPDQVLVLRLTADKPGAISFTATLSTLHEGSQLETGNREPGTLILKGKAPTQVDPKGHETAHPIVYDPAGDSTRFECHLRAIPEGGTVSLSDDAITVKGATAVTLILSAATSYNGPGKSPSKEGRDPAALATNHLQQATGKSYTDLRARHLADYQPLFNRCSLTLGPSPDGAADLQTDDRVNKFSADDPANVVLHFQYGRYLLISSARGTLPPNLQGIWNDLITPPWSSNYTTNINTEMNHWPAEPTGLPECHEPLFSFIESLAKHGARTAQVMYGCRGWCCHHNADAWAQTGMPGGYGDGGRARSALWPMAAPWLCTHLYDHYRFSLDRDFLASRAYPIMKGACEFYLDFLVDDGHGHLVTNPSTSPENDFVTPDGKRSAVAMASTMDMALIWDLFTNTIESSTLLNEDAAFRNQLEEARAKLFPPTISPDGRLQEWFKDFKESDVHHRHVSHLWGVYPGRQITPKSTPDLFAAARKSLEVRGDVATGWSSGWKINLWARFGDGDHAMILVRRTLRVAAGGVYPNLFGSHPPFQMDGNFAFPAGVSEMLLQSHTGTLHLLPALPTAWPAGRIEGLRARGHLTLDLDWNDGALARATLTSHSGGLCKLRYRDVVVDLPTEPGRTYTLSKDLKPV